MDNEFAKHEIDFIRRYEAAGYKDQYRIVGNELENLKSNIKYTPKEVMILKEHRYEGMSDPSDLSLLYVIETMDGSKGTMLANYGANADNAIHEFMNLIPKRNINPDNMVPPDVSQYTDPTEDSSK